MVILSCITKSLLATQSVVRAVPANPHFRLLEDEVFLATDSENTLLNAWVDEHLTELKKQLARYGFKLVTLESLRISPEELRYWAPGVDTKSMLEELRPSFRTEQGKLPALLFAKNEYNNEAFTGFGIDPENPERSFEELFSTVFLEYRDLVRALIHERSNSNRSYSIPERRPDIHYGICEDSMPMLPCEQTSEFGISSIHHARCPSLPEELSPEDESILSHIQEQLDILRAKGISDSVLGRLLSPRITLSPIQITSDYRILLPKYGREIEMISGDKVLYLLLLRHPEGILQKCLSDYVAEMKRIHLAMNNGFLTDRASMAIEAIAYADGACNQRISRIRRAFLAVIAENIAENYIPTSGRGEPRRIPLDPSLVQWDAKIKGI